VRMIGRADERPPQLERELDATVGEDRRRRGVLAELRVENEPVEVEHDRTQFAHLFAAQSHKASTRPSIVWRSASTSTDTPWPTAVAAVIGPMHATTGGTDSIPNAATNRSTVEELVKVTTSAERTASSTAGSCSAATVR